FVALPGTRILAAHGHVDSGPGRRRFRQPGHLHREHDERRGPDDLLMDLRRRRHWDRCDTHAQPHGNGPIQRGRHSHRFPGDDSGGRSGARTIAVIVNPLPTVSMQASVAATDIGVAVHFTSTLTAGTAPIRYAWDFKDASSSTAVAPAHEYARAGVFVVELIVTDAVKVTAATTVSVTVNALPAATAKASNSGPTVGESVGFTASVTDGTSPFTYAWVFGDGAVSSVQNPSHAYSAPGTYPVHLWVNDSVGGSSVATITV